MGRVVTLRTVAALLVGGVLVLASAASGHGPSAHGPSTHRCPTFTGPGDNLVHSRNFKVANVSCATGKRVVERCDTNGTTCRIAHSTWRCHGRIPGETRCTSGPKVAQIYWLD